jgi:hypothetical protein
MKNAVDVIACRLDGYLPIGSLGPGAKTRDLASDLVRILAANGYTILRDVNNDHLPIDYLAATHDSPEYACGLDAALPPATERN